MWIDSKLDGGNIEVVSCEDPTNIRVKIKKDTNADFSQWFSFHLYGAKNQDVRIVFENAGTTSYPKGWEKLPSKTQFGWSRLELYTNQI